MIHNTGTNTVREPRRALAATLAATLAAALLAAPAAVSAQGGPEGLFGEVIDVRVVNLEVVVTDGRSRVSGLGPEDFVLTVDGREVPIEYFTEVSGGTAAGPAAGADELGTVPALAPGQPVGTSYLLFVDDFYTAAARRNLVLRRMIEQLPMLTPEDRMAVVAYDGKQLEMLSTWSQSTAALTRVLEGAMDRPARGAQRYTERRLFIPDSVAATERASRLAEFEQPELLGSGFRVGSDLPTLEEEQLIERLTDDVKRVVMAAASTLRSFANPPGRKVMLLISGGWPYTPAQWVVTDPTRALYTTGYGYGKNLYRPLIETANRLSYTLYPIDVPLQADTAASASVGGREDPGPNGEVAEDNGEFGGAIDNLQDQRTSLRRLAFDTGGRAILANDTLSALERVVTDTRSYYWIGFTPDWQGDDETHKVDVRPRRRGLSVRTRQSFSDLSRETEVTMMVESALRLGDAPTMTPMPARVGEIAKAGRNRIEVPVEILVPMSSLTFLPYEDHYLAEAELRVAVLDEEGTVADIPVTPMTIRLEEPPKEGEMRRWGTKIKIRKEKHDVVVSVYDNASGTILSTKLHIDPF